MCTSTFIFSHLPRFEIQVVYVKVLISPRGARLPTSKLRRGADCHFAGPVFGGTVIYCSRLSFLFWSLSTQVRKYLRTFAASNAPVCSKRLIRGISGMRVLRTKPVFFIFWCLISCTLSDSPLFLFFPVPTFACSNGCEDLRSIVPLAIAPSRLSRGTEPMGPTVEIGKS